MEKKNSKILRIILLSVLAVFILVDVLLFYNANYIARKAVHKIVWKATDSVYNVDFERVRIEIFTKTIIIENFKLIPDTSRGKDKNLFLIRFDKFELSGISLMRFAFERQLKVRLIKFTYPEIRFYSFKERKLKQLDEPLSYKLVKEDILSGIFNVFSSLKIKRIEILHAKLDFLKHFDSAFRAKDVLLVIEGFYLDEQNFSEKDLFAKDFEIQIFDYKVKLGANYLFYSDKLIINKSKQLIFIEKAHLKPSLSVDTLNMIDLWVDRAEIKGADFQQIYLDKVVDLAKVKIDGLDIRFYKLRQTTGKRLDSVPMPYQLFLIVKDVFHYISVDTLETLNARYVAYQGKRGWKFSSIRNLSFKVYDFFVDSAAAFDTNRFYFAKEFNFQLNGFNFVFKDRVHTLNIGQVSFNTETQKLKVEKFSLIPLPIRRASFNPYLLTFISDDFEVEGFDLKHFFFTNNLALRKVAISNAKLSYIKQQNFVKKQSKTALNQLLAGIINNFSIDTLIFDNISYSYLMTNQNQTFKTSGTIDLFLSLLSTNFSKDVLKSLKFKQLDFTFSNFLYQNSSSLHFLKLDTLVLSSTTNLLLITGLRFYPSTNKDSLLIANKKSIVYDFYLPHLIIKNFDLNNYLQNGEFDFGFVYASYPVLEIVSYPEYSTKKFKQEFKELIRQKAAQKLVLLASQAIFEIYQSVPQITDSTYKVLTKRITVIDSIQNFAMDNIFKIYLPNSQIRITDTTAKNVDNIYKIAADAINQVKLVDYQSLDTLLTKTIARIEQLTERATKLNINFDEIASGVRALLKKVIADSIVLNEAKIIVKQKIADTFYHFLDNKLTVKLFDFYFDTDSLDYCKEYLFCSKGFELIINDYHLRLKDSIHTVSIGALKISSLDSNLTVKNMSFVADSTLRRDRSLLSIFVPELTLRPVDYKSFFETGYLDIRKLNIPKAFVHITLGKTNSKEKKQLVIQLPIYLKSFGLEQIFLDNVIFRVEAGDSLEFSSKVKFALYGLKIDSVFLPSEYLFYLPIDSFEIAGSDLFFRLKDWKLYDSLFVIKSCGDIKLGNVKFESSKLDLTIDTLGVVKLDYEQMLKDNKLLVSKLFLNGGDIDLKVNRDSSRKTKKTFTIDSLNLYKLIGKIYKIVIIDSAYLLDFDVNFGKNSLNDLSLILAGFYLDSTVSLDSPKLFYSDNVIFQLSNFERVLNKDYNIGFERLIVNLDKQQVRIDTFRIYSSKTLEEFVATRKWRTAYVDLWVDFLSVNNIDWLKLLKDTVLEAANVLVKGLDLYAYTDKALPHNFNTIKPHIVDLLAKIPFKLYVKSILIQEGNIVYEEKLPDNKLAGHIELNSLNAVIANLTNDFTVRNPYISVKLYSKLAGTADFVVLAYFKLDTTNYPFRILGTLGSMDLRDFNDFLVYGANLQITSGWLYKAEFYINGEDSIAVGEIKAIYDDLNVDILKPSEDFSPKPRKFLSFIADVVVRSQNPKYGIFFKTGKIAYIHDRSFGDINFWIKSILSGVKSLVLFENKKQQKKISKLKQNANQ